MINQALIIGGSSGIGLALSLKLLELKKRVIIVDKNKPDFEDDNLLYLPCNLINNNYDFLDDCYEIDTLIVTAGFGRITNFETILPQEIYNSFQVNAVSVSTILNYFFSRMKKQEDFYCAVLGSIAGLVSSPLFALYGATKAAVCSLIESLNIELEYAGTQNRILNVSPGSIKGTMFNGGQNDLTLLKPLAESVLEKMYDHETLFIPDFKTTYKNVLDRYASDSHQFGMESFQYKMNSGRINAIPQIKVGYLSGTFDLFHVGHLNLLKRAKDYCDYLVVGVHKDASHKGKETFISLEERMQIVRSVRYVDKVIISEPEDYDVYKKGIVKYDFLFVGSDYKGTERFNRYEEYFADKNVRIIYFPYTEGTSSTQLRTALSKYNQLN